MSRRKRKAWSSSFGRHGAKIRVFEDTNSGILYGECRDPSVPCGYRTKSLRHRDKERAERWAIQQVAKLQSGEDVFDRVPRLGPILGLYLKHQSPKKCDAEQQADERRAELWRQYLGDRRDLRRVTKHQWDAFIELRHSGAIDSRGREAALDSRRPVRTGTVAADLVFLRSVISWATKWQTEDGRYLLSEDVTRGFEIPSGKNPRRPVATTDRYQRLLAMAGQVEMDIYWSEKRVSQRSYLRDLLVLAYGTGRRIGAICSLRYEDLRLDLGPHGSIRWPAATDKIGRESVVPISSEVRAAIDGILEERPGIGAAPLFPAPQDPTEPITRDLASSWLLRAEELAGVEKHDGSLWHAYRRAWATARKHLPDPDVAFAGGWADASTLRDIYQRPDQATVYEVVSQPMEIREA